MPSEKEMSYNMKAQWTAYRQLRAAADNAWEKLRSDVHHKASLNQLIRDRNDLALILGECDYMARECISLNTHTKKH